MRRPTALAALLATTALVAAGLSPAAGAPPAPPAAPAPGPDTWTSVSTGTVGITTEASLYRSSDQVLHALYPRQNPGGVDLAHAVIKADGTASQSTVVGNWSAIDTSPALVAGPAGGLRAVFGGLRTSDSSDPYSNGRMVTATAPAAGDLWTLQSSYLTTSTNAYGSYGTAATTLEDGTPLVAFPLNSTITWNAGTGPDSSFAVDSCCTYDLALARSGSAVWVAWHGNGGTEATDGVFVRQIRPGLGPIQKAPGASPRETGRVAMTVRPSGEVYMAYCSGYPTCAEVRLWQVGSTATVGVPGSAGAQTMGLSAAPNGELWVAWSDGAGDVKAVRTFDATQRFGSVVGVGRPGGATATYALAVDGQNDRADLVINAGAGAGGLWHRQVAAAAPAVAPTPAPPALRLKATPSSWRAGQVTKVRFTVTGAGAKVRKAKVAVGKKKCTTSKKGVCTITFPAATKPGKLTARATRAGYGPDSVKLTVKKPKK